MDLRLDMPGMSGDLEKDIKNLSNYVFRLSEDLRYALYNLDVTNFNDLGLARYENGRLQVYSEKLQVAVKQMEIKLSDAETGMAAEIKAAANGFSATVQSYEKQVGEYKLAADGFSAKISGVTDENGNVTAASIAAKIKDDESLIQLIADEVDIDALTTFTNISESDGQTQINGAYILSAGENSWDFIAIDGGFMQIGTNGYLGMFDEGIVRLKANRPRITGTSDVVISSESSFVYIYPKATNSAASHGWGFGADGIYHYYPETGEWKNLLPI